MKTKFRSALLGLFLFAALGVSSAFGQVGQACTNGLNNVPVLFWSGHLLIGCPADTQVWTVMTTSVPTQSIQIPLTLSQLQTLNSIGVEVLPAQGSGTLTEISSCILDMHYGSAPFTGGGTVTIGYGATSASIAAAATIASTVWTTFSSSHSVLVAGALAVNANSSLLNTPIWMNAASADFAAGTGASGVLTCSYRVWPNM